MNLLSHVAVPTDKKTEAHAPQGWPFEQVLVRQLMPRTSETEHTTDVTVTLWRSIRVPESWPDHQEESTQYQQFVLGDVSLQDTSFPLNYHV